MMPGDQNIEYGGPPPAPPEELPPFYEPTVDRTAERYAARREELTAKRYGDCERCYFEHALQFCDDCRAWLCVTCLEHHDHGSFQDQRARINRAVYDFPTGGQVASRPAEPLGAERPTEPGVWSNGKLWAFVYRFTFLPNLWAISFDGQDEPIALGPIERLPPYGWSRAGTPQKLPHHIACNYQDGPLGGYGCICVVVTKQELARAGTEAAEVERLRAERERIIASLTALGLNPADYAVDDLPNGICAVLAGLQLCKHERDRLRTEVAALEQERDELRAELAAAAKACDEASAERLAEMVKWYAESEKWKSKGDMYGWNFHQGMAAGANRTDIIYYRVRKLFASPPGGAEEQAP